MTPAEAKLVLAVAAGLRSRGEPELLAWAAVLETAATAIAGTPAAVTTNPNTLRSQRRRALQRTALPGAAPLHAPDAPLHAPPDATECNAKNGACNGALGGLGGSLSSDLSVNPPTSLSSSSGVVGGAAPLHAPDAPLHAPPDATRATLPASERRLHGSLWISTYTDAARRELDDVGWTFDPKGLVTLERVIGARCPDRSQIVPWLASTVQAFLAAVKPRIGYYSGGQPAGLERWWNARRPTEVEKDRYGKPAEVEKPYRTMSERSPHAEAISQEEYDSAPDAWAPQIAKGKFYIFNPREEKSA